MATSTPAKRMKDPSGAHPAPPTTSPAPFDVAQYAAASAAHASAQVAHPFRANAASDPVTIPIALSP